MAKLESVTVTWNSLDLCENAREMGYELSRSKARRLLKKNADRIESAMLAAGLQEIERLLDET